MRSPPPIQEPVAARSETTAMVLILRGHVRLLDALALQEAILKGLAEGHRRIVVDLSAVERSEPALLLTLLRGARGAARNESRLVVVTSRPDLEKLLGRIGADKLFSTTQTLHTALDDAPHTTRELWECRQ